MNNILEIYLDKKLEIKNQQLNFSVVTPLGGDVYDGN
ncbi:hypothetical protein EDC91_1521 [Shewanella fodinae]|uniref:Uncharacterized protein n=1 Tax=Shewanella fodinae TaxID=552357 RepID=A0A4R2FCG3_9GAMM|nr:hypothetical protein EDC91_1521 [Shewanella fodinae]